MRHRETAAFAYQTENEQYYLLTLAAIAQEIRFRKAPRKAEVVLAAGSRLPVSDGKRKTFGITCWKEKIR